MRCGREEPDRREDETAEAQQSRKISERHHAGDDRRGGEHDRDLEGGRGDFEIVIARERMVALLLGVLGFLGELLAALAGRGLRIVAIGGLAPVLDLLLLRGLKGGIRRRERIDRHRVGGDAQLRHADRLCLEERPQIRGSDVDADRAGLRAFAERLRERQKQRQYRDQQCDSFVRAFEMMTFFRMFRGFVRGFVCFRHISLPFGGRTLS